MKQILNLKGDLIKITCRFTMKEKLKILFSKQLVLSIDPSISSDGAIQCDYLPAFKK